MNRDIEAVKKNMKIIDNMPLKYSIYQAFRTTIISGNLSAGTRINEKVFAESLNISRTPIRYALSRLAEENLVKHVPKIGIVVTGVTEKDAYEVFDIRKALDSLAAIKAMRLMTSEDFAALKHNLELCEVYNREDKVDEMLQLMYEFNEFIYEKSQMVRLKAIVQDLKSYLKYFRDICIRAEERRSEALAEHWLIYRGMRNQDEVQITLVTHEHLDRSLRFILKEMNKKA